MEDLPQQFRKERKCCRGNVSFCILIHLFGNCLLSTSYTPDPAVGNESIKKGMWKEMMRGLWIEYSHTLV